jgi:hypothetical protein
LCKFYFFTDDDGKWTSLPEWAEAVIIILAILSGYLILIILVIRHIMTKKNIIVRETERTAINNFEAMLVADRGRMFVKIMSLFYIGN